MNARAPLPSLTDAELWHQARRGDRRAFGDIVERYKTLICSVAYSACGHLARSEDLAQETFVAAWRQLADLREPQHLKAWLCGIARRLAANDARRETRRGGPAVPLDTVAEPVSADDPAARLISDEEEALLWRSLARMPETVREPMVLFYRQENSIADVAESLELSEDAVKQRLSRGRAMLRDELAAVVESALARSRPGIGFTIGVLGALPAVTPPNATAAALTSVATGKAAGAVKAAAGLSNWALIGPVIGLVTAFLASRAVASTARSPEEKRTILRHSTAIIVFCWVMSISLALVLMQAGKWYVASPLWIIVGVFAWTGALVGTILWASRRMERRIAVIRVATATDDVSLGLDKAKRSCAGPLSFTTRMRLLGLPLIDVAYGGDDIGGFRMRRAVGWIAIGDFALSPLLAFGGFVVAPVAIGACTLGIVSLSLWGAALGVLAFGAVAAGWWAFGLGALGIEAAGGAAAAARDYAIGGWVTAAQANTEAAHAWIASQWFAAPVAFFLATAHWIILAVIVFTVARLIYRARRRSRTGGPDLG
jgi:RNA polymerase sigma factor (sigma-70 family)